LDRTEIGVALIGTWLQVRRNVRSVLFPL